MEEELMTPLQEVFREQKIAYFSMEIGLMNEIPTVINFSVLDGWWVEG